jgi:NADH:ubiquinone oxidoreductase subunit K
MSSAPSAIVGGRPPRTTREARHRAPGHEAPAFLRTLWVRWLPPVLFGLGVMARVRQWLGGRSLWLDEVLIADNLVHRGFWQLATKPLVHFQIAPVLWLELEHLAVVLFGPGERALRLLPLLAGITAIGLTWILARRLLPDVLVPLAVLLTALHPALIYYSNEVKQYSTDVAVVLVLVLLAQNVPSRSRDGVRLRRLVFAGAVAVWFSHVAVLALAGITVVLIARPLMSKDRDRAVRVARVLSPWLLSFVLSYVVTRHSVESRTELGNFWRHTYPHSLLGLPAWFGSRWYAVAADPLRLTMRGLGLALLALGLVRLGWFGRRRAALAWAGVPMALLAAALHVYPFADRLVLWTVPLVALALAAVLPHRLDQGGLAWLLLGSAALTVVTGPAVGTGLQRTVQVQEVEELKPLLRQLAAHRQLADVVLVEIGSQGAFDYYSRETGVSRDGVILFASRAGTGPCNDRPALETGRFLTDRVWVVSSHRLVAKQRLGTLEDLLGRIRTVSREVEHLHDTSADAYLFDPSGGAEAPTQTTPSNPERCLSVVRSTR